MKSDGMRKKTSLKIKTDCLSTLVIYLIPKPCL